MGLTASFRLNLFNAHNRGVCRLDSNNVAYPLAYRDFLIKLSSYSLLIPDGVLISKSISWLIIASAILGLPHILSFYRFDTVSGRKLYVPLVASTVNRVSIRRQLEYGFLLLSSTLIITVPLTGIGYP